jgi:hypothetical protein
MTTGDGGGRDFPRLRKYAEQFKSSSHSHLNCKYGSNLALRASCWERITLLNRPLTETCRTANTKVLEYRG